MDRDTLLAKLRSFDGYDKEMEHIMADAALLSYINDPEITQAFDNVTKWYA